MNNDSGASVSVWMATAEVPVGAPLKEDVDVDVCVVGAGIAGMTTAYLLAREGKSVVVLDDGTIGGGETGRTTAHLSNALDDRYYELERLHGEKNSRLAAASHTAAIDLIERIVQEEEIDCDFTRLDGYLFVPPGEKTEELDDELKAAHRAGLVDVERVDRAPVDSFDTGPALRFPRQGQFHPLKYLAGLAKAIEREGGKIHGGTHVVTVEGGPRARVRTSGGAVVTAIDVVVATNSPIVDLFAIHTKQAPYRTYVIGARIPRGSVPRILLWDTPDPYHYIRLEGLRPNQRATDAGAESGDDLGAYDLLIIGGEDHKTAEEENPEERFTCLEEWARERFPMIERVEFRWSGQVMEPIDGMAFIGRDPMGEKNVYVVTGDSGNGMTHGTVAGMLLTDLIMGRHNDWEELYDPDRITLKAAGEFLKEGADVVAQYTHHVTPGDVDSEEKIAPGEGAVIRDGLSKLAVYRDPQGEIHRRSAVCTHLGCVVAWNDVEKSWDCGCHGSRFDPYGQVLNGPAIHPLEEKDQ